MSITISIEDNCEYCKDNNLVEVVKEYCYCDGEFGSACSVCKGSEIYNREIFPFELNLANGNFSTLWNALGLDFDHCGFIDPRIVSNAIKTVWPELVVRATKQETGLHGSQFIDMGIPADRVERYLRTLSEIADEAEKREQRIEWC